MIKYVFISLPMRGLEDKEIEKLQSDIYTDFLKDFPKATLLNPYQSPTKSEEMNRNEEVHALGDSLMQMSYADVALFAKGWEKAPGCIVEHSVCDYYGVKVKYVR